LTPQRIGDDFIHFACEGRGVRGHGFFFLHASNMAHPDPLCQGVCATSPTVTRPGRGSTPVLYTFSFPVALRKVYLPPSQTTSLGFAQEHTTSYQLIQRRAEGRGKKGWR
jgi:hypothetical protein